MRIREFPVIGMSITGTFEEKERENYNINTIVNAIELYLRKLSNKLLIFH